MNCQRCQSARVISVAAKCSDCCGVNLGDSSVDGYVPKDLGIGGGDYVEFLLCLECGQLQGNFPLPPAKIEKQISDEEIVEFFNNHFSEGSSVYLEKHSYIVRQEVINSAEEYSSGFGIFIRDYFESNSNRTPTRKHPSVERFIQMFRSLDHDLSVW